MVTAAGLPAAVVPPWGTIYPEPGKVATVSGVIDNSTGSANVRARFKNDNGMLRRCRSLVDCCLVLYLVEGEKGLSLFHILPFVDIYLGDESRNTKGKKENKYRILNSKSNEESQSALAGSRCGRRDK